MNEDKKTNEDHFKAADEIEQPSVNEGESLDLSEKEMEELDKASEDVMGENFSVELNEESQKEKEERMGVKKEADGKTLTIKEIKILAPRTKTLKNGVMEKIPPIKAVNSDTLYYTSKMAVRFEEDNLVEYYPGITFFVNEGKINPKISINRNANSKVAIMFRQAMSKMAEGTENAFGLKSKNAGNVMSLVVPKEDKAKFEAFSRNISDKAILDWMVGKKVLIETVSGTFNGREWFRNDIKEFL